MRGVEIELIGTMTPSRAVLWRSCVNRSIHREYKLPVWISDSCRIEYWPPMSDSSTYGGLPMMTSKPPPLRMPKNSTNQWKGAWDRFHSANSFGFFELPIL